jgi:hypothetical protein
MLQKAPGAGKVGSRVPAQLRDGVALAMVLMGTPWMGEGSWAVLKTLN